MMKMIIFVAQIVRRFADILWNKNKHRIMTIIVGIILVLLSIVCFILSFRVGKKGNEVAKALEDFEAAVEVAKQDLNGIGLEEMVLINDEKLSEENLQMKETSKPVEQQICERRNKWLEIERLRKESEQKQREQREEKLRQQKEKRLEIIQKIKDSLQWQAENEVYELKYIPIDDDILYMDLHIEHGIVNPGEIVDAVFRYRGSDIRVQDIVFPCRGVLSICVEPFYKQSYEIQPNMAIIKVDSADESVAAYELNKKVEQQAIEKAAQIAMQVKAVSFEEEKKLRELQKEEREKEMIRRQLLAQKKRRELERKVQQEMFERGELAMEGTKRRHIPHSVVSEVYRRDGAKCVICGSVENLQLDHIIPFSKGGADTAENLQVLCQKCNLKKSNKI
jgi:hypothetical protein